jgi:hypothetical protein
VTVDGNLDYSYHKTGDSVAGLFALDITGMIRARKQGSQRMKKGFLFSIPCDIVLSHDPARVG